MIQRSKIALSFLVFCVAAGMNYDIDFGVRVPAGELLAFASLPFLLHSIRWRLYQVPLFSSISVLLVWVFAVCLSDFVNGISLDYFLRGLAKPIWCGFWTLFFVGVISHNYKALYSYPIGLVLAGLQNYFFPQAWTAYRISVNEYEAAAYGLVPLVIPVLSSCALYAYRQSLLFSILIYFLGALFLGYTGAPRSTTAICLLIAFVVIYMWWSQRQQRTKVKNISIVGVVILGVLFLCASYTIFEFYTFAASKGWMGEMQQQKLRAQSHTIFGNSFLGLLVSGRTSVFASILAVIDQPLRGFGSWQSNFLYEYYLEAFSLVGTDTAEYRGLSLEQLPGVGHSIFFGVWIENGILAALSLLIIGFWIYKEFLNVVFKDNPLAPLFISIAMFFSWSYFFSPFGVESRLVIGFFLATKITRFCENPPNF